MLIQENSPNTMDINSEQSLSNGGMNANQNDNSNFSRTEIENTPFHLISDEKGHYIVIGAYRVGEVKETKQEALKQVGRNKDWKFITDVISSICDFINKQNEKTNQILNNNKEY